jgi:MFS family permease
MLLLTRCFVGIGEAAYGPVAPPLISDFYPVKVRGRILAWFYMAIPVGSALGYVIGDLVSKSSIDAFALRTFGLHAESWRWAFYLVMPPGLLLALWALWMRRAGGTLRSDADTVSVVPETATLNWREYLVLLRTPSYVYCSLGMAAMTFAIGGIGFWMPYYLEHRPGATGSPTTIFGAITVVAGLTATLLGGVAGDRLRSRFPGSYFLVSGAAMLAGFPFFVATLWTPFPWIWIWLFAAVFCLFFNTGPTNTILANVTHPAIRAVGFAVTIFVIHALGDVPSPVIIGMISDRFDMNTAFLVVSAMFPVSAALWLAGTRHLAKDTEGAPFRLGAVR